MGHARMSKWLPLSLLAIGVLFHALYVFSVITIYFQSPLVFGLAPHRTMTQEAPAKRLVLFVADGLRADKFFERNMEAPFLRTKMETEGLWGVSHTRVPTESRPGHVAMIAGFYEDVSAVTKGWKENPVEFDSVFNRSRETWAWGSPDILPMFSTRTDHMTSDCYPAEYEDFGKNSALHLDTWVFDKIENFFHHEVPHNPDLQARLRQDKVVFFLHLLGIDTIGHAKRPTGKEYTENILAVDAGIQQVVKTLEDFYGDKKTAYVFSADHGMADRGTHGDGDPQNTETPFLAWGAGVRHPLYSDQYASRLLPNSRPTPDNWRLHHLARLDITQADIAPLMATLIGVPIPVNSVGVLPTDYLDTSIDFKASALLDNANAILLQYKAKETERNESSVFFSPFAPLLNHSAEVALIQSLIAQGDYANALTRTENLIELTLQGLRYYQIYDKWFLLAIVISGYLGFMAFTSTMVVRYYTAFGQTYTGKTFSVAWTAFGALLCLSMFGYLSVERAPLSYYFYSFFPFALWTAVFNYNGLWRHVSKAYFGARNTSFIRDLITVLGAFGVVHVVVYGFHKRAIFAVCFWALCGWGLTEKRLPGALQLIWTAICLILSIFPLIPVDSGDMTNLLVGSGFVLTFVAFFLCKYLSSLFNYGLDNMKNGIPTIYMNQVTAQQKQAKLLSLRQYVQIAFIFISNLIVYTTELSIKSNNGLPLLNQLGSWTILVVSLTMLVVSGDNFVDVLLNVFLSIAPPMILVSINYEVLFVMTFFLFCITWVVVERYLYLDSQLDQLQSEAHAAKASTGGYVTLQNLRVAAIYILCCFFAFFGTGHLAGFAGFEISSAFRFQTVFDPFLMSAIIMMKGLLPFVLLCAVYGVLNRQMNVSHQVASFLVVSVLSDSMTLDFLLQVKDSGSWREIGLSLSNFVMLNFFLIFQMLLAGLTNVILRRVPHGNEKQEDVVQGHQKAE